MLPSRASHLLSLDLTRLHPTSLGFPHHVYHRWAALLPPPYHLRELHLWSYKYTPGVGVIRPIFVASAATLRHLEVLVTQDTLPALLAVLPLVAANLTYLQLTPTSEFPPAFISLLKTCTSITTFSFFKTFLEESINYLPLAVGALPNPLVKLRVEAMEPLDAAVVLQTLVLPAANALKFLDMVGGKTTEPNRVPQAIIDECARRGEASTS